MRGRLPPPSHRGPIRSSPRAGHAPEGQLLRLPQSLTVSACERPSAARMAASSTTGSPRPRTRDAHVRRAQGRQAPPLVRAPMLVARRSGRRLRSHEPRRTLEDLMPASPGPHGRRAPRHKRQPRARSRARTVRVGKKSSFRGQSEKKHSYDHKTGTFQCLQITYISCQLCTIHLCLLRQLLLHVAETEPEEEDARRACAKRHSRPLLNANRESRTNQNRGGAGPFRQDTAALPTWSLAGAPPATSRRRAGTRREAGRHGECSRRSRGPRSAGAGTPRRPSPTLPPQLSPRPIATVTGTGSNLHVDPSRARRWVQRLVVHGRSGALKRRGPARRLSPLAQRVPPRARRQGLPSALTSKLSEVGPM